MKLTTIHANAMGDVLNPTSATGVRIADDTGRHIEIRTESGHIYVHVGAEAFLLKDAIKLAATARLLSQRLEPNS